MTLNSHCGSLFNNKFYNSHAQQLADSYLSKSFEEVHQPWLEYLMPVLNKSNARILDIGAGAGRDSKYLAQQGSTNNIQITAVEPAQTLAVILNFSHTNHPPYNS